MKYNEIIIKNENGEEVVLKFRLTSGNAQELERKNNNMPIVEYLQNESITMVVTMIRYMLMWNEPNIGEKKAQEIYDMLIDNGWTYKSIIQDIVYETLVCSGFLEKTDWEEMKRQTEEITKKLKEESKKAIENI